jgi:hypothetical protein
MRVDVAVTVKWDAAQFAIIAAFLSGEDRAKMVELTTLLRASDQKLADAIAKTTTAIQP